jgi:hypothetical protein
VIAEVKVDGGFGRNTHQLQRSRTFAANHTIDAQFADDPPGAEPR